MNTLLDRCPCFIPAAISADIAPRLVRVLSKLRARPSMVAASPLSFGEALLFPVACLNELTQYDRRHMMDLWRPLIDAGILPILIDLNALGNAKAAEHLLLLSATVLLTAPSSEVGQLGANLLGEIARLASEGSPAVTRIPAAQFLYEIGMEHPQLILGCRTWKIEETVEQLMRHPNPDVAEKAQALKHHLFAAKMVSAAPPTHIDQLGPFVNEVNSGTGCTCSCDPLLLVLSIVHPPPSQWFQRHLTRSLTSDCVLTTLR
jgi:hypothetical protein